MAREIISKSLEKRAQLLFGRADLKVRKITSIVFRKLRALGDMKWLQDSF